MTAQHADQLIDGYLARLSAAAADFPAGARNELLEDMRSHIAEARSREQEETDATILNILDRLGEPETVVADARDRLGLRQAPAARPGVLEIAALVLLLFPWPVGVVLLWLSSMWSRRDKIIGSIFTVGGYPTAFVILALFRDLFTFGVSSSCPSDSTGNITGPCSGPSFVEVIGIAAHILLFLVVLLLPVFTVTYLAIRLRSGRRLVAVAA
jgi:uncharacterized membrane protein